MAERPLRCAFLNHYVDWGGAEGMLVTLFEAMDRRRIEPILVVPGEGRLAEGARAAGVRVVVVPVSPSVLDVTRAGAERMGAVRAAGGLATSVARLLKAFRSIEPDVVVTNSAKAHVYGSIAAGLSRRPVVWRLNDTLDSPDFGSGSYRLLIAIAKRVPRAILSVSESCAAPLLREGVARDRISVLYSGIDLAPFTALPAPSPGSGLSVGSFGRLTPLKGHDVVLRAVAHLAAQGTDVELVIAGGPAREAPGYEEKTVALASELGLSDRVRVVAGFPDGALPEIMSGVGVVVQASVLPDSLPTTVIEAMAGARAVVASRIGGCPELLDHDRTGLLFPPGDVEALARCLKSLDGDSGRITQLGAAARQEASRRFDVDSFADGFSGALEQVGRMQGKAR